MVNDVMDVEIPPKDAEELELEKLVFGDLEGFTSSLRRTENLFDYSSEEAESEEDSDNSDISADDGDDMFFIDDGAVAEATNGEDPEAMEVDGPEDESETDTESDDAWQDSDDERIKISLLDTDRLKKLRKNESESVIKGKAYIQRLRSQFEKIYAKPEWIDQWDQEKNGDNSSDEESEEPTDTNSLLKILASTDKFVITKQLKLISPNKISITRLKDANETRRSKSGIQSLSFHHSHPLLLTGGFDRTLRIYHIDGRVNNIVTSLHLRDSPIYTAHFSPLSTNGERLIYAGGRRRYMNKWDLNSGEVEKISRMYGHEKYQKSMEYFKISSKGSYIGLTGGSGWCNILSGQTGQWVKGFKIEGTIVDFEFASDESFVIVINSAGEVWEFDLKVEKDSKQKVTHVNAALRRWQDDSGVGITKIKLGGPKNRWLAVGTNNGIVNIYDRNNMGDRPRPIKTVENLVTTISMLQFSPDGQILCIASRAKRDALKLVHLPTGSVYSNWPTSGTPLGRVTDAAFSPNNEMLAIGNEGGKVTLWRLNHY